MQAEVVNTKPFEVVFTFVRHPYLGIIVEANAVQLLSNGDYSLTQQKIRPGNVDYFQLNSEQAKAVKAIEELEPDNIMKLFYKGTKKIRSAEFFTKHYKEEMHEQVRAHIERKLPSILELIKNYPLFMAALPTQGSDQPVKFSEEETTVLFHLRRDEEGTNYFATLKCENEKVEFYNNGSELLTSKPVWLLTPGRLHHFGTHVDGKKIKPFLSKKHIHVDPRNEPAYMDKFVRPLLENHDVFAKGVRIVTEQLQAKPILKVMNGFGEKSYLSLYFQYGDWNFPYHVAKKVNVWLETHDGEYTFHRVRRSVRWESEKISILNELGLRNEQGSLFSLQNSGDVNDIISWLNESHDSLQRAGFDVQQDSSVVRYFTGSIRLTVELSRQSDWFDVLAMVQFGDFSIPFIKLKKHIVDRKKEFLLPDGSVAIIPDEWFSRFSRIASMAKAEDNVFRLKKIHFPLLSDIEDLLSKKTEDAGELEKRLAGKEVPSFDLPDGFKADLRSYQLEGYNWIRYLHSHNINPMLADDMGLGKTIQTLAVLQHLANERNELKKAAKTAAAEPTVLADHQTDTNNEKSVAQQDIMHKAGPSMVVAPKSLLHNWKFESAKFTPKLKVLIYNGLNRSKYIDKLNDYDLIILSYGTIRNDVDVLKRYKFNCIVLDESQAIKNPNSLTARQLQFIESDKKLALTGTPIENTLMDIWSQMNFLNNGLLGNYSFFEKQYITPIEKKADAKQAANLRKILDPFVLRRTKKQVAKDLPEKIEKIQYCEMSEAQQKVYDTIKNQYRNEILEHVSQVGITRSKLKIFNGLMHLRQLALNPAIKDADYEGDSCKDDEIRHMLYKAMEQGHKVLLFSQFVSYLKVFKEMLEGDAIPFCYLDGSMDDKQRSEQIQKFQENDSIKVFLLSLRAGNSGINLTSADYVFLADPWWNPFTMRQAEDRAHRIGQEKTVFSYKFITKNTIEEKILKLQAKKTEIAGSIIPDEDNFLNGLSVAELEDLLI